jgi:hypothetical protein
VYLQIQAIWGCQVLVWSGDCLTVSNYDILLYTASAATFIKGQVPLPCEAMAHSPKFGIWWGFIGYFQAILPSKWLTSNISCVFKNVVNRWRPEMLILGAWYPMGHYWVIASHLRLPSSWLRIFTVQIPCESVQLRSQPLVIILWHLIGYLKVAWVYVLARSIFLLWKMCDKKCSNIFLASGGVQLMSGN